MARLLHRVCGSVAEAVVGGHACMSIELEAWPSSHAQQAKGACMQGQHRWAFLGFNLQCVFHFS